MSSAKEKGILLEAARRVFEESTATSLGSTFHLIMTFHLKQRFNQDPYEVLIDDPKCFYNELKEVLGAGAETLLYLVGTDLAARYHINCTVEEFVKLFIRNGKPQRSLSQIFTDVANQEESRP